MPGNAQQYESKFEHISSGELITGYLRRLKESHALLKVTIPDHSEICNSVLVEINDSENYLLLDKLHPVSGHNAFMKVKRCTVRAQHQGVEMGFVGNLEKLIEVDDSPTYRISFPKELLYHQKRSAYRAAIGVSKKIEVMLSCEDNTVYAGTLHNISTGGFCVNLPKQTAEKLKVGDLITTCRFTTNTGVSIESAAEIRNIKVDEDKKTYRSGMRFVEISPQELRALQRFVLTLEREQIKRSR